MELGLWKVARGRRRREDKIIIKKVVKEEEEGKKKGEVARRKCFCYHIVLLYNSK